MTTLSTAFRKGNKFKPHCDSRVMLKCILVKYISSSQDDNNVYSPFKLLIYNTLLKVVKAYILQKITP